MIIRDGSVYQTNGITVRVIRQPLNNGLVCVTTSPRNKTGLYGFVKAETLSKVSRYKVARFIGMGKLAAVRYQIFG